MKLKQYRGPFTMGQIINVRPDYDYQYVHIGIQIPFPQPIAISRLESSEQDFNTPEISIGEYNQNNMVNYKINKTGMLEFDELAKTSWSIQFLKAQPAEAIIDLIYTQVNE